MQPATWINLLVWSADELLNSPSQRFKDSVPCKRHRLTCIFFRFGDLFTHCIWGSNRPYSTSHVPPVNSSITTSLIAASRTLDVESKATSKNTKITMVASTQANQAELLDLEVHPTAKELVSRCLEFFEEIKDLYSLPHFVISNSNTRKPNMT